MGRARALVSAKLKQTSSWCSQCSTGCCMLWFVPRLWHSESVWGSNTHAYMRTVFSCCERAECGEEEKRGALLRLLAAFLLSERWPTFSPGKKKKKRLVQQTVRICEGWEEMEGRRKVKAKNERNRKTTYRKKLIGQARKQSKWLLLCCEWVNSPARLARFLWTHNKKSHNSFYFPVCIW